MFINIRKKRALILSSLFTLLLSCKSTNKVVEVNLEKRIIPDTGKYEKEILKFGIGTMLSPSQNINYYAELVNYIGEKLNIASSIVQRSTYSEMNDLLILGGVDLAFVCTGAYIHLKKKTPVEIVAVPVVENKKTYHSLIIVRKNSSITSFKDLRGKSFAFVDTLSLTGRMYPLYRVIKLGFSPEEFFQNIVFSGSHDSSIEMVARGVVDGAGVDSIVYKYYIKDHPEIVEQVKVIEKSPPFGIPPIVTKSNHNPLIYNEVRGILLNMHTDTKGAEILKKMHFDRFDLPDTKSYETAEKIVEFISSRGY